MMPLRILMICTQFRPLVGGYERAAERLSIALSAQGHRVVVAAERRQRAWPVAETFDGCELKRLPCLHRRNLHTISSLASYGVYLLRHGREFDVWHVHNYGPHAALAVALGKLLGRRVVLKSTNSGPMGIAPSLGQGMVGRVLGHYHRQVGAYLAISDETRAEAIAFGIPVERIHLIPNGLDENWFRPATPDTRGAARRELGLQCRQLVLSVGRLSAEKNPTGLLEAWANFDARRREGVLLAMVGDGPDRDGLRAKAVELGIADSVLFAGRRDDVATWYRAADLYVIASDNEGLANTMIEALASGLPVLSTRVSGSSALIQRPAAGVLVDVGNMAALTAAMASLLQDDATRSALGNNARGTFERLFSLRTVTRKMIELYSTLLPRHRNRGTA